MFTNSELDDPGIKEAREIRACSMDDELVSSPCEDSDMAKF